MAFVAPNQGQNEEDQNGQPTATGGGTGGLIGGGGSGNAGTQAAPQASGGSGAPFANIRAFLDANKDQAGSLAETVGNTIKQPADQLGTDINTSTDAFTQSLNDSNQIDQDLINRSIANPTQFTQNKDDVADFQRIRNNQIHGNRDFSTTEDFRGFGNRIEDIKGRAGLVGTEDGRNQLLEGTSEDPTAGKTAFNQLLLALDPNAQNTLQTASDEAIASTQPLLDNAQNTINQFINKDLGPRMAQGRNQINDAFIGDSFLGGEGAGLVGQLAEALRNQGNSASQDFMERFARSEATRAQGFKQAPARSAHSAIAAARGGSLADGNRLFGNEDVASQQQRAEELALQELLEQDFNILQDGGNATLSPFQASQRLIPQNLPPWFATRV